MTSQTDQDFLCELFNERFSWNSPEFNYRRQINTYLYSEQNQPISFEDNGMFIVHRDSKWHDYTTRAPSYTTRFYGGRQYHGKLVEAWDIEGESVCLMKFVNKINTMTFVISYYSNRYIIENFVFQGQYSASQMIDELLSFVWSKRPYFGIRELSSALGKFRLLLY